MSDDNNKKNFAFGRTNYLLLAVAVVILALGYMLLAGGGSDDPNVFNEAMFDTRRMYVAPILIVVGFVVAILSILYRPKQKGNNEEQ